MHLPAMFDMYRHTRLQATIAQSHRSYGYSSVAPLRPGEKYALVEESYDIFRTVGNISVPHHHVCMPHEVYVERRHKQLFRGSSRHVQESDASSLMKGNLADIQQMLTRGIAK